MPPTSHKGYDFGDLTGQIIRAALNVHAQLGPGFREVIYQRALLVELQAAGLEAQREFKIPLYYRGHHIGTQRVDFLVEDCMVEVKAHSELRDEDFVQALSYLKASRYPLGLLINFGSKKLGIKRLLNDQPVYDPANHHNF